MHRIHLISLTGHELGLAWLPHKARYTGQSKMDGSAVDYAASPLLRNPWVYQQTNSPSVTITIGRQKLACGFANWTRTPSKQP